MLCNTIELALASSYCKISKCWRKINKSSRNWAFWETSVSDSQMLYLLVFEYWSGCFSLEFLRSLHHPVVYWLAYVSWGTAVHSFRRASDWVGELVRDCGTWSYNQKTKTISQEHHKAERSVECSVNSQWDQQYFRSTTFIPKKVFKTCCCHKSKIFSLNFHCLISWYVYVVLWIKSGFTIYTIAFCLKSIFTSIWLVTHTGIKYI